MEFIKEGTLHGLPPEENQFRRAWSPTARCVMGTLKGPPWVQPELSQRCRHGTSNTHPRDSVAVRGLLWRVAVHGQIRYFC